MRYLIQQFKKYDPAAKSALEIFLLYPGFKAVLIHGIAHSLYKMKFHFMARALSEFSRLITGIDIHPGAVIGRGLIIDHGMGTVIGETSIIGNDCIIYQGVTLGGTSLQRAKRHPTLEDRVVIGAGAKILGNITIGSDTRVGANSVVIDDVPANSTMVGIPARRIAQSHGVERGQELAHQNIDPEKMTPGSRTKS